MALKPGARIGPYEIVAPLGAGGMGEVYRAIDTRLGRTVALKVLPEAVAADEARLRRFEFEARAVAEVSHPNILNIFDFGRDGEVVYAALEFVEGTTLRAVLAAGPIPPRKAADYARQIALGLSAAHARDVLHRDIKPDNVMVTVDGQIKLLDFGLARRSDKPGGTTTSIAGLTDPGKVLGTLGYMAPEQVRGGDLDERADIFAVGVVLFEMLSGESPFARSDRADSLASVLRDDAPPLPATLPVAFQRIVRRCLEKSPAERYQSASDLAFSLEAFDGSSGSGPMAGAEAVKAPRSRRQGALALIAIVAAATAVGWFSRGRWTPAATPASFDRVTFRRGTISRARFAPGGQSIYYGAAWEGRPFDVFETVLGNRDARPRGLAPAELFAISPSGDLAIEQGDVAALRYMRVGRLAIATASGAPRSKADDVSSADWTPDGQDLVVSRRAGAEWRIEWPIGTVIYRTDHSLFDVRMSPAGDRVAWLEHTTLENIALTVADRHGQTRVLAQAGATSGGVAWAPGGQEVWYTAGKSVTLTDLEIRAVTLDGRSRVVLDTPGGVRLLDIAPDGRVLVSRLRETAEIVVEQDGLPRPSGWQSSSSLKHLSQDGRYVLFSEDGPAGFDLFLRPTDGGPAVKLRAGLTWDQARLSPDGQRVAIRARDRVLVIPVGPGGDLTVAAAGQLVAWLPDNRRILLWGAEDRGGQPAVVSVDAPGAEEVLPLTCAQEPVLVHAGMDVACISAGGAVLAHSLVTRATRRVEPDTRVGRLIGGNQEGRLVFYMDRPGARPVVRSLDLVNGRTAVVREPKVPDSTGVWRVAPIFLTADGRVLAYSLTRRLDELYVYSGLR